MRAADWAAKAKEACGLACGLARGPWALALDSVLSLVRKLLLARAVWSMRSLASFAAEACCACAFLRAV